MFRKIKLARAITIIEMIVVVAIVGLISSTVIVSFTLLSRKRLDGETAKLVNELKRMRQRTRATGNQHGIGFDTSDNSYVIDEVDITVVPVLVTRQQRQRIDIDSMVLGYDPDDDPATPGIELPAMTGFRFFDQDFDSPAIYQGKIATPMPTNPALVVNSPLIIELSYRDKCSQIKIYQETGYIVQGDICGIP